MLGAELGLIAARRSGWPRLTALAFTITIATGVAATVLSPDGLGEVPVLAGAANLPMCLPPGRARAAAIGTVAVVFGASIVVISRSAVGLMVGVGAWALADRSIEHAAFQSERDRAVAAKGAPASIIGPIDRAAELARDGVQEARAAVGVLRATRLRGLDDLAGLVGGFPGDATLSVTGQPGYLDPEEGHAVYRAVQEALTNAARYATGSSIDVTVAWGARQLAVSVVDHGLPARRQPSGVRGSGTGIVSMTARIEAIGGTFTAGPSPAGPGWRVEALVPVTGRGGTNEEVNA